MKKLEFISSKILDREQLRRACAVWKFKDMKVVFTNGCFDILHLGHIEYLAKAASLGDFMVLGLNSDSSVRRLKGENRPVQDEYSRAVILAGMEFIDAVIIFEEETPYNLIKKMVKLFSF